MTQQIDTTQLNAIAAVSYEQFRDNYLAGGNTARDYYQELARQGNSTGNTNIENYALLATDVTTNEGSNGKMANGYSKAAAKDDNVAFEVGSDEWLRMQHELMIRALARREQVIADGN
ncbi:MAG: hypothetical protein ACFB15_18940 [Cyclobacteriaceae bacterium]